MALTYVNRINIRIAIETALAANPRLTHLVSGSPDPDDPTAGAATGDHAWAQVMRLVVRSRRRQKVDGNPHIQDLECYIAIVVPAAMAGGEPEGETDAHEYELDHALNEVMQMFEGTRLTVSGVSDFEVVVDTVETDGGGEDDDQRGQRSGVAILRGYAQQG